MYTPWTAATAHVLRRPDICGAKDFRQPREVRWWEDFSAMGFIGWWLNFATKHGQSFPAAGCVFSVPVKRILPPTQTIRTDDNGLWPGHQ